MGVNLEGRVAATTGASSGIGAATARALAAAGASMALGARREDRLEKMRLDQGTVLEAEDIANAILYAVSQPDRVSINEILVRPTGQRG